ncbi:MAG: mannose-1-phosphate guanylyltransferase, partial [Acidimicrobiia bacterium]
IVDHLPELPAENFLGEPLGRDTANAIGFAGAVLASRDPQAELAFLTADHVIEPVSAFQDALRTGFELVERDPLVLVTFGIPPSSPHTGLGYIERAEPAEVLATGAAPVFAVSAFTEKPDLGTATAYLASGRHLWNSGMFVWRASTLLDVLDALLPESASRLRRAAAAWGGPSRDAVLGEVYPELQKISVDYAVMEPASQGRVNADVVVVPMPVQWLDVGSWAALAGTLEVDASGNRSGADCLTCLVDSRDNVIVTDDPDHLIATVGLSGHIVVHTADVTMVCPLADGERIKELVAQVQSQYGPRFT